MSGWEVIGVCILAVPAAGLLLGLYEFLGREGFIVLMGTAAVIGLLMLGGSLAMGEWHP